MKKSKSVTRCAWCPVDDALYVKYHDEEWGLPEYDGGKLFEMLNLEGAQAGLSWRTVLHKRENYRKVFQNFDPKKLARWTDADIAIALQNPGIIRNRLKVRGVIRNTNALKTHFNGDLEKFSEFLWTFVKGKPIRNTIRSMKNVRASTEISDAMSKALRKMDFTFVGSTICDAFMQAVGMVNDHSVDCFISKSRKKS
ncbi:MAG: DNA-3-methyladenine glycosylase I [Chthoniobacterales bacterium]